MSCWWTLKTVLCIFSGHLEVSLIPPTWFHSCQHEKLNIYYPRSDPYVSPEKSPKVTHFMTPETAEFQGKRIEPYLYFGSVQNSVQNRAGANWSYLSRVAHSSKDREFFFFHFTYFHIQQQGETDWIVNKTKREPPLGHFQDRDFYPWVPWSQYQNTSHEHPAITGSLLHLLTKLRALLPCPFPVEAAEKN